LPDLGAPGTAIAANRLLDISKVERESSGSRTVIDTRRRHRSLDVDCSIHATPPAAPIRTLPRTARDKNKSINSDLTQRPLFLAASRTESGPINNPFSSFRLDRCEWHKMRTIVTDVPSSLCLLDAPHKRERYKTR